MKTNKERWENIDPCQSEKLSLCFWIA